MISNYQLIIKPAPIEVPALFLTVAMEEHSSSVQKNSNQPNQSCLKMSDVASLQNVTNKSIVSLQF